MMVSSISVVLITSMLNGFQCRQHQMNTNEAHTKCSKHQTIPNNLSNGWNLISSLHTVSVPFIERKRRIPLEKYLLKTRCTLLMSALISGFSSHCRRTHDSSKIALVSIKVQDKSLHIFNGSSPGMCVVSVHVCVCAFAI